MRDKMKYHTMREIPYTSEDAFAERLLIYRYISKRSLETGEQTVLLPLELFLLKLKVIFHP